MPLFKKENKKSNMYINKIHYGDLDQGFVNVIIEIPTGSHSIKYEYDKENGILCVDRFIPVPVFYPFSYGFIPQTIALDGDPLDVVCISSHPPYAAVCIPSRPVGVLNMEDDGGEDSKIVCVPVGDYGYESVQDVEDLSLHVRKSIEYFFSHYKDDQKGKWVKLENWGSKKNAVEYIRLCVSNFSNNSP